MNAAVLVPPAGLLESSDEVLMKPSDVRQLVIIMLPSRDRELRGKEGECLDHVADVLAAGSEKRFFADSGEIAGASIGGLREVNFDHIARECSGELLESLERLGSGPVMVEESLGLGGQEPVFADKGPGEIGARFFEDPVAELADVSF